MAMHRYDVYILTQGTTRKHVASGSVFWRTRKLASSRVEAVIKALPQIHREVLPYVDPSIRYIAVYVGRRNVTESASRLAPLQIVRSTGNLRYSGE